MLKTKLLGATAAAEPVFIEDVFSTYLYTGNGSTQTITNGIDTTEGAMTWLKSRNQSASHFIWDTINGPSKRLLSDSTLGGIDWTGYIAHTSTGFTVTNDTTINGPNYLNDRYVSWTFRKAERFFDVVTWTGDGVAGRAVSHGLNTTVGSIFIKRTDSSGWGWVVYHRQLNNGTAPEDYYLQLQDTAAAGLDTTIFASEAPTGSVFYVGSGGRVNASGGTYVAYLFAHDPLGPSGDGSDGLIACGSYAGNSSTDGPEINLGWEPQWVMIKGANVGTSWYMFDNMRGIASNGNDPRLQANQSDAEFTSQNAIRLLPNGFKLESSDGNWNGSGNTYIYIAIRRGPMREPTSGTEVYKSVLRNGTGTVPWVASGAGFPPDMTIMSGRNLNNFSAPASYQHSVIDRVRRATEHIQTLNSNGEGGGWGSGHIHNMDGYDGLYSGDSGYYNATNGTYVDHHFRRAPGFFDVVAYNAFGVARTEKHNLAVVPEMMIVKRRNSASNWPVYHKDLGSSSVVYLDGTSGTQSPNSAWNSTAPTATQISLSGETTFNGGTYIAYLFATLPGVSKVGSYTGNGSSQTINCGFTSGARFVLIKRTDSTGDWYVWDTARGIVAGNDPHLSLNTDVAEVTTNDSIDPDSSGFIVNQLAATNINVSSAAYIYLAIA